MGKGETVKYLKSVATNLHDFQMFVPTFCPLFNHVIGKGVFYYSEDSNSLSSFYSSDNDSRSMKSSVTSSRNNSIAIERSRQNAAHPPDFVSSQYNEVQLVSVSFTKLINMSEECTCFREDALSS
jgi:hypothetical protein